MIVKDILEIAVRDVYVTRENEDIFWYKYREISISDIPKEILDLKVTELDFNDKIYIEVK